MGRPYLVLIDGGKGQLDAAISARDEQGCTFIPFIGLAKREEQIVIQKEKSGVVINEKILHDLGGYATPSHTFVLLNIPHTRNLIKLLQRIRDESHRFAVTYHSVLKQKRQTSSVLDEIPGIGPVTRKKLLKTFGSVKGVSSASEEDLLRIVNRQKVKLLRQHLHTG